MAKAIFLTGKPGAGKTTAIRDILERLDVRAGGFYTQEIREGGRRVGFKIVTLDGGEGILAHVDIKGHPRIGKYGVDLRALDEIAVRSLHHAKEKNSLIILDEIGPMEILSDAFRQTVVDLLEAEVDILGSIMKRSSVFANRVKNHPRVTVLELRRDQYDRIIDQALRVLDLPLR